MFAAVLGLAGISGVVHSLAKDHDVGARTAPHFEPLAAAEARRRVVRAGAAVWAATLVLWAFFLFVIASKLGQKDATVAEKKAAQRDRRRRTCVTRL